MRKILIGLAGAGCLTALGGAAQAASFDCNRARTSDEKAICANRTLNDKDVQMAQLFSITKKVVPMGMGGNLRDTQQTWLVSRNRCRGNVACLNRSYDSRIAVLNQVMERVYRAGPF